MPFPPSSSVQASTDGGIGFRKRSNEGNGGLTEQKNILISVRLRLPPLLRSERRFLRSECRFLRPPPYRRRRTEGSGFENGATKETEGLRDEKNILISVRLRLPPLLRSERRFLRSECRFLRPPPYRRRRTEGSGFENGATKETEANGAEKTFDLRSSSFASVAPF